MDRGDLRRPIIRLRYWPTLRQLCRLDEAIAAISRSDRPKELLPTGQSEPRSYVTVSNFHKDPLTGLIHAGR